MNAVYRDAAPLKHSLFRQAERLRQRDGATCGLDRRLDFRAFHVAMMAC
jgi:hypothetical protein